VREMEMTAARLRLRAECRLDTQQHSFPLSRLRYS